MECVGDRSAGAHHGSPMPRIDQRPALAGLTIDEVIASHATVLGRDREAYRNHAHRVASFCLALMPAAGDRVQGHLEAERVGLAAAFHDIGIWTHGTFDYLEPSVEVCRAFLVSNGRSAWVDEISAMIREHHKVTAWRVNSDWLVEPFRKADWIDVTRGTVSFGVSPAIRREVFDAWPSLGFRRRLLQFTLARLARHPLNPLPMLRL